MPRWSRLAKDCADFMRNGRECRSFPVSYKDTRSATDRQNDLTGFPLAGARQQVIAFNASEALVTGKVRSNPPCASAAASPVRLRPASCLSAHRARRDRRRGVPEDWGRCQPIHARSGHPPTVRLAQGARRSKRGANRRRLHFHQAWEQQPKKITHDHDEKRHTKTGLADGLGRCTRFRSVEDLFARSVAASARRLLADVTTAAGFKQVARVGRGTNR